MKTLKKKMREEFKKIMKAPEILKEMKGQACFVCGQPYDKSPQVKEVLAFIEHYMDLAANEEIEIIALGHPFKKKINHKV